MLRNLDPTITNGRFVQYDMIDLYKFWQECHTCRQNNRSTCHKTGVHSKNTTITIREWRLSFKFIRKQFPVRLCFAMTRNKAQGQIITNVGLCQPQYVFSHGQLYVALSRGISMVTTKVLVITEQLDQQLGTYTRNVVYKNVLGEIWLIPSLEVITHGISHTYINLMKVLFVEFIVSEKEETIRTTTKEDVSLCIINLLQWFGTIKSRHAFQDTM